MSPTNISSILTYTVCWVLPTVVFSLLFLYIEQEETL
uniref:Photosystem I reaction center subunit VIII n=1 Tax=Gloeochaete wittrockiana TaxID=38269 RepID=A0A3G1IW16_9EUKA|nr:photosystem I subunit VIII [Gloeochaete wittrockiana]ASQ40248.1 photosystem I subunit VIII [Gloeochaete wittrockiana]